VLVVLVVQMLLLLLVTLSLQTPPLNPARARV